MKLAKSRIQTIIQEELIAVLSEQREAMELQRIYEGLLEEYSQRNENMEDIEQHAIKKLNLEEKIAAQPETKPTH